MPKITNHAGPSNEAEAADSEREPPATPADELRARGKLGPYETGPEDEVSGDGSGEPLPELDATGDGEPLPELDATGDSSDATGDDSGDVASDSDNSPDDADSDTGSDVEPDEAWVRPATNATKAAWVAYAETVTGETVDPALTKAELIELYGSNSE